MVQLSLKFLQKGRNDPLGVVGFDIAGDEGTYPLEHQAASIRKAQALGIPVTVHAGEWPENSGSLQNIKLAVDDLRVHRIGHGITLRSDVDYLAIMATSETCIEVI